MTFSLGTVALATTIATVAQVAMVLVGHRNKKVAGLFAVGGMSISLLAGVLYATLSPTATMGPTLLGGAVAGGVCALIGIAVSFYLKDVTAIILLAGTLSSAATGAIGGFVGRLLVRAFS